VRGAEFLRGWRIDIEPVFFEDLLSQAIYLFEINWNLIPGYSALSYGNRSKLRKIRVFAIQRYVSKDFIEGFAFYHSRTMSKGRDARKRSLF
jgi:hypothetical protein